MDINHSALQVSRLDTGILKLTLQRPSALNALNKQLMDELMQAFLMAKTDKTVKAILLTGSGKAFCAGADINQLAQLNGQSGLEFAHYGQKVFRTLEQLGKPSLAAINGFALGGGCELAMAATLRVAADTAIFGQPEIKLGVIPGFGGTQRLARLIGKGRALDLCLTGKNFKAQDALNWGLVTEVVPLSELEERSQSILSQISKLPPFALKSIMSTIDHGYDLALNDAFELEAVHFGLCCATQDKKEGVSAFLEKRQAEFRGE